MTAFKGPAFRAVIELRRHGRALQPGPAGRVIHAAFPGPPGCHLRVWRETSEPGGAWLGVLLPLPALLSAQQGRAILRETSPHGLLLRRPTRVLGCGHGHTGQLLRSVLSPTGHLFR